MGPGWEYSYRTAFQRGSPHCGIRKILTFTIRFRSLLGLPIWKLCLFLSACIFGHFIDQAWPCSGFLCLPAVSSWIGVMRCLPWFWASSLYPS